MKQVNVLDSSALLAYLHRERNYFEVKKVLASPDSSVVMNDISVGETYYILVRERGRDKADYFISDVLPNLPIKVIHNKLEQVLEAARLQEKYYLPFAGSFSVVTAVREKATLVTADPQLGRLGHLVSIDRVY